MNAGKWEIASLVRRLADSTTKAVAGAKQRLTHTDVTLQRIKAEVGTRRRMMDAALRKKLDRRGK